MDKKPQNKLQAMIKRTFTVALIAALLSGFIGGKDCQAQIYLDDESMENSQRASNSEPFPLPDMPGHDNTLDYTPLGSGIAVLGLLGGAYLVGKRRKESKEQ